MHVFLHVQCMYVHVALHVHVSLHVLYMHMHVLCMYLWFLHAYQST